LRLFFVSIPNDFVINHFYRFLVDQFGVAFVCYNCYKKSSKMLFFDCKMPLPDMKWSLPDILSNRFVFFSLFAKILILIYEKNYLLTYFVLFGRKNSSPSAINHELPGGDPQQQQCFAGQHHGGHEN